jgi:AraC-like DNA-binding protein
VLVPQGDSHKVEPSLKALHDEHIGNTASRMENKGGEYVRLVIYLSPRFLTQFEENGMNLRNCFLQAKDKYSHVVRESVKGEKLLLDLAMQLKQSVLQKNAEALGSLFQKTILLQFMILLNREIKKESIHFVDTSRCNKKVVDIIQYINSQLTDEISIDRLSEKFYISKYHMMRQFKAETGYTIGNYINQKRLLMARELLRQGEAVTKIYLDVGFKDYSTFVRAYKQLFGEIPSKRGTL